MKRNLGAILAFLLVLPLSAKIDSFKSFLSVWEQGALKFLNGDPKLWIEHSSHSEDATIFGAFGGYEKGWAQVGPRYEWASAQFKGGENENRVEYLTTGSSGDLAFTVSIEHKTSRVGSSKQKSDQTFRVTQIFRREKGQWKLLHRHADPLMEKKTPN